MKYVLLLTRGAWQDDASSEDQAAIYGQIGEWFGKYYADGTIVEASKLQGPHTATTVVIENGSSMLIDRPLLEAKEAIGGYAVVNVDDLDAALALAQTWPVPDGKVEVRPVDEM
ncbi:MAG TPA: YciI family protein [Acidimicrobiales bacterium]|jgi:hypothetical protein|nr:YciI family protein [Acidimicrobiales bacterium]